MEELYQKFPFKSAKKFIPVAVEHGYTAKEAKSFLESLTHDHKFNQRQYYLPIYSERPDSYQFDTLVQTKNSSPRYFLIAINVNSRKLYAYPMKTKNSESVLEALNKLKDDVRNINSLTSDQDKAYLTEDVLNFIRDNKIDYRTTEEHDHNRLGIINRVIRTLRDMNDERDFTEESMSRAVTAYNNSIHSSIAKKPNSFNQEDERKYIYKQRTLTDSIRSTLPIGSVVRVVNERGFGKRRSNLSERAYLVDSLQGNQYLIKARDDSIAFYPRHKLYLSPGAKLADTIDDAKKGIVDKILDYNPKNKKYKIEYVGGVKDWVPVKSMREGRPAEMSPMEKEYWSDKEVKF